MSGSIGYQIFNTESDFDTHEISINTLLVIPQLGCTTYREKIKHLTLNQWAGTVTQILVDACAAMTPAERLVYYDDNDLKTPAYLDSNGWFPTP